MLREIRVRNFAVIDAVTAAFGPGLNVLTGETGAGKSMLIDAILLIRGARAQTDVIRTDTEAATVEAVFDVEPQGPAAAVLHDAGLGLDEGQLVVRRELTHSGRHRAFVNDSPVTVGLLERLGDHLVEVHGQHEHQRLLEVARQLDLLDRFADAEESSERVGELFAKHQAARAEVERTRAAERDRAQREDLLRFQLSELDGARLRVGEEDERLDVLTRLTRKYGDTEATMLAFRQEAAVELERLGRHEEFLAEQERMLGELRAELQEAAVALADRRRAAAERLAGETERELRQLGMERARFQIAVGQVPLADVGPRGLDRVEFRLSAHPGEDVRPLARVASGGELSRTMLALKAVLARADRVPTMIFDEVDAGIGGRVAAVVAQKLAKAAEGRQVLCVTHLAPIAARAAHHVRVSKGVRAGRTRVSAEVLTGEARVEEVARMVAGARVTETARGHARELLGRPSPRTRPV